MNPRRTRRDAKKAKYSSPSRFFASFADHYYVTYAEHGVFRCGTQATSALLQGFAVGVSAVFDAE